MKVVIDIDEEMYKYICKVQDVSELWDMYGEKVISSISSIRNGKPYEESTNGDLISRSALKEEVTAYLEKRQDVIVWESDIYNLINNAPTVETSKIEHKAYNEGFKDGVDQGIKLSERPKGEWKILSKDATGVHEIECPFCKYSKGSEFSAVLTVTFDKFPPFCENCGAELVSKENKNE